MSIPKSTNKTEMDNARSKFEFDGPGSFSVNLKAIKTNNSDINYIEVTYQHTLLFLDGLLNFFVGLY